MLSHSELPLIDFKSMPPEERKICLNGLRMNYPKSNHFEAGQFYQLIDKDCKAIIGKMAHDVFLLRESRTTVAWYVGFDRDGLFGREVDRCAYSVSTELLYATDNDQFAAAMTFYVVNVDFEKPLDAPSAQSLTSLLPSLVQSYDVSYFKKGATVLELDNNIMLLLTLSDALIPRKSLKYPNQDRFGLMGDLLGEGSFSEVYRNPTTLRIGSNGLFQKTERPRVARFTFIKDSEDPKGNGLLPEVIQSEDAIMVTQRDRFKSKPSFFKIDTKNPSREVAIRFEACLPGENLAEIFDRSGSLQRWSLARRLRLAIAFLRALNEQVCERGVIHCDIKPANVMVAEGDTDFLLVNIIDFNLSRLKSDRSIPTKARGSRQYFSPERFDVSFIPNEASDVFAAGVTVAEMFSHYVMGCPFKWKNAEAYAQDYKFINLFANLPEVDRGPLREMDRDSIARVLTAMVHPDPSQRPCLSEAAFILEHILSRLTQGASVESYTKRMGV